MSERAQTERRLEFSDDNTVALLLTGVSSHAVIPPAIVVNVSDLPAVVRGTEQRVLAPLWSTVLQQSTRVDAESLILFPQLDRGNIDAWISGKSWKHYSQVDPGFPAWTPLWISPHDRIGRIRMDPLHITGRSDAAGKASPYDVTVNLWFARANTDCGIHSGHGFIEVHTQIYGTGKMQKFRTVDPSTLYEEVTMAQGSTHEPFATVDANGRIQYPWHQYHAESDCIWMAIELHPPEG
jgi:hypothetical protein